MFGDKNSAAIYLERNSIIFANPSEKIFEQLPLDKTLINHLEINNEEKFVQTVKTFLEQYPADQAVIFLAKPLIFEREITQEEQVEGKAISPVDSFLSMVPFDKQKVGVKILEGETSQLCLATNKKYYESVKTAAELAGYKIQSVVPAFLFEDLENGEGINADAIPSVLEDKMMLSKGNFIDKNSKDEGPLMIVEETTGDSNPPTYPTLDSSRSKTKTIVLTILLICLLSFSLIFSYANGLFDSFLPRSGSTPSTSVETAVIPSPVAEDSVVTEDPIASQSGIKMEELRAKITNGTGVSGQAGRAQDALAPLKMKETLLDPVATRGATTTRIGYDPRVPVDLVSQVKDVLAEIFSDVEEEEATDTGEFDFLIVTGKEK